MRRSLFLLALLLPPALAASDTYFPNTPGTQWRYSNGETQQAGRPRVIQGVNVVPVGHSVGGKLVSEDYLEYRADGVFLRGVQAGGKLNWYTPPLQVYPASPLAPGQVWTTTTGSGLRLSGRVVGTQALRTQSGSYNALVVRSEVAAGGAATGVQSSSTQYAYFVPGLGVVRYQTADGSMVDLLR
ncbi:hypothetical protein [Deinococcus sp.]|uniref:hypothetical protein n=1 Tax=Deinococcus sp. TaxID=47478 RepID=UPI003C7CAF53